MHRKAIIVISTVAGLAVAGLSFEIWGPGFLPPLEEEESSQERVEDQEVPLDRQSLIARVPYIVYIKKQILVYNDKLTQLANELSRSQEEFSSKRMTLEEFYGSLEKLNMEFRSTLLKARALQATYADSYPEDYVLYFHHLVKAVELYKAVTSEIIGQIETQSLGDVRGVSQRIRSANEEMRTAVKSTPKLP